MIIQASDQWRIRVEAKLRQDQEEPGTIILPSCCFWALERLKRPKEEVRLIEPFPEPYALESREGKGKPCGRSEMKLLRLLLLGLHQLLATVSPSVHWKRWSPDGDRARWACPHTFCTSHWGSFMLSTHFQNSFEVLNSSDFSFQQSWLFWVLINRAVIFQTRTKKFPKDLILCHESFLKLSYKLENKMWRSQLQQIFF